ncbi:MAG: TlpA family protein disulfide reductase [Acidobacteriota bacterium]|nr:TlpA family protein disulfide reductase [Acidobacteriota bacterium]
MKRSALVLVIMVAVVAAIVWAGARNLRARRQKMQAQEERQSAMMPDVKLKPGEAPMDSNGNAPSPLLHKPAPAFKLATLDGRQVSLADFKGRPLVVNLWATWCGPCKIEMPWFQEFRSRYAPQGFEVLGIADDPDAGNDAIAGTAHKLGVTYPILLATPAMEKAYGDPEVLPMSFYVDKAGDIVEVTAGLGSKDELEAKIKETIAAGGAQ